MDITKAFNILMTFEGGLSNNSNDAGGLTKYGISHAAYPNLDIAKLTQEQAKALYESDYWNKAKCRDLPTRIQYIHFDTAVNMGIGTAIKLLQEAANVAVDGQIGPETLSKANNVASAEYLLHRLARYTQIVESNPSQLVFLKGWTNRVMQLIQMSKKGDLE